MKKWIKKTNNRHERSDGAVVMYDESANCNHAKPWTGGHKGWMAYLPAEEYPLYYKTKRGLHVPIKYKTHVSAILKIEKLAPLKTTPND